MKIGKMNRTFRIMIVLLAGFSFYACNRPAENKGKQIIPRQRKAPAASVSYHFEKAKAWLAQQGTDSLQKNIVMAVNRTDAGNIAKMDSILIPNDLSGDIEFYLPFPVTVPAISQVDKIIFFSYPAQIFAAYENGELVYTGPVNMGRKHDPTPTGLYFTNWKAEQTTSTFNDEWDLHWNFNIENKLGIGFHQYELPGYPASHSCLRLQEKDARYLYNWADQWVLDKNEALKLKGTAVVVFGVYDFDGPKPWLQLANEPKALNITPQQLEQITTPYLNEIMTAQTARDSIPKP